MKINFQWPKSKEKYYLNPWYVIVWRLCAYPLVAVSAAAFYVSIVIFEMDFYKSEQFRKEYFS